MDPTEETVVVDDPDWVQFPELKAAVARAGGEENSYAIAELPSRGVWAVGLAGGVKNRDKAARLALVVALCCQDPTSMMWIMQKYPEFGAHMMGGGAAANMWGAGEAGGWGAAMGVGGGGAWGGAGGSAPQAVKISLPPTSSLVAQGLSVDAPAVLHGGKAEKTSFSNACNILGELVDTDNVEMLDDENGDAFPDIHAALLRAGWEASPICVAACAELGLWGVGVAYGKQPRERAARLSLALAIAGTQNLVAKVTQTYPEFGAVAKRLGHKGKAPAAAPVAQGWAAAPKQAAAMAGVPVPQGVLIQLPPTSSLVEQGLSESAPALLHGGKTEKQSFMNSNCILGELESESDTKVEMYDDEEGQSFPDIHAALKDAGFEESPLCIAAHAELGVWGSTSPVARRGR